MGGQGKEKPSSTHWGCGKGLGKGSEGLPNFGPQPKAAPQAAVTPASQILSGELWLLPGAGRRRFH